MAVTLPNFAEPRWFVCHTKPRCEKKFSALLATEQFVHYLPLVPSIRRYHDRTKKFTRPLFAGYVFAEIPPTEKNIVASGVEATLQPLLKKGTRVKIVSGPLWGVEGFVEDPKNSRGVLVAMDVLQQGLLVPVPMASLEILH